MNYNRPELLDKLAAEYVLGTLHGRARRRFEKLKATLPAAAAAVREWEHRTAALAHPIPAVEPSRHLWPRIEQRLGFTAATSGKPGFWQRLGAGWLYGAGSFALGLVLAFVAVNLYPTRILSRETLVSAAPPPQYVGLFADAAGKTVMFASSTTQKQKWAVRVTQPIAVPEGKVLELWAIPDGKAPVPLGVVPSNGKATVAISEDEKFFWGVSKLAVSIEDGPVEKGAAPTQVILSGLCAKLW